MESMEAMQARHSVRNYTDKPIEGETLETLERVIDECNRESGLHIQLVRNEPMAFGSGLAHYGKFAGVKNYLALVGKKDKQLDEKCGYYGVNLRSRRGNIYRFSVRLWTSICGKYACFGVVSCPAT